MAGRRFHLGMGLLALGLALLPLAVRNPYHLNILNLIALDALAVTGLGLLVGLAGQISLGHAAFMGLGAYLCGILTVSHGLPPWLSLGLSLVLVALVALLVALPTLRLKGNYLVMATLGFNLIVTLLALQLDGLTGGPSGFAGIPPLSLAGHDLASDQSFYYLAWAVALLGLLLARNLTVSRVGRALLALHDSEPAAAALGVPVAAYKVKVFVLSAVYAGLAGGLYAHYLGIVTPKTFDVFRSVELVTMNLVGGLGAVGGGLLGAAFLSPLPQLLHFFDEFKDVFYGAILVAVLVFLPGGLAGLAPRRRGGAR